MGGFGFLGKSYMVAPSTMFTLMFVKNQYDSQEARQCLVCANATSLTQEGMTHSVVEWINMDGKPQSQGNIVGQVNINWGAYHQSLFIM